MRHTIRTFEVGGIDWATYLIRDCNSVSGDDGYTIGEAWDIKLVNNHVKIFELPMVETTKRIHSEPNGWSKGGDGTMFLREWAGTFFTFGLKYDSNESNPGGGTWSSNASSINAYFGTDLQEIGLQDEQTNWGGVCVRSKTWRKLAAELAPPWLKPHWKYRFAKDGLTLLEPWGPTPETRFRRCAHCGGPPTGYFSSYFMFAEKKVVCGKCHSFDMRNL